MKIVVTILTVLVVATFGYFVLVEAQSPPLQVCGDFDVQSPNDAGKLEKCDDGPLGSDVCTNACGQKLLGWAWADTFGWASFNNSNCNIDGEENYLYLDSAVPPGSCPLQPITHFIQVDVDDNVLGYAWSDSVGWICFGDQCNDTNVCNGQSECEPSDFGSDDPPGSAVQSFANLLADGTIVGWAKILSEGDNGWVSLNCENTEICGTCDAGFCSNWGTSCSTDEECTFKVLYTQANFNDTTAQTLNGWGWNSNDNGEGIGWIQFNPPIGEILPWLQTKYGDIYARGDISGNPIPNTAYNATYRILSGGSVSQFSSLSDDNLFVSPFFGPIDFPTPDTRYSNVLGQLDLGGLIDRADGDETDITPLLGGLIYYISDDLIIGTGGIFLPQFDNGVGFEDGSGTIIVEGDLIIKSDILYDPTGGTDRFRNLASVAWIVLGDLQIDGSVKKLAGNFIILGNADGNNNDGESCLTAIDLAGCGQILSCFPGGNCDNRLTVSGLMMAKIFDFQRTFVDDIGVPIPGGSEIIIYDGRLLANTPPGLGDFAKALPIWRAGTFER